MIMMLLRIDKRSQIFWSIGKFGSKWKLLQPAAAIIGIGYSWRVEGSHANTNIGEHRTREGSNAAFEF
jgi:hypothetical protein